MKGWNPKVSLLLRWWRACQARPARRVREALTAPMVHPGRLALLARLALQVLMASTVQTA